MDRANPGRFAPLLAVLLAACSQTPMREGPTNSHARSIGRKCEQPKYPPQALTNGEQGVATIRFHVDPDGEPIDAAVVRTSGSKRLDDATIDALMQCKFQPQIKDGRAVESYQDISYTWRIK
jgi:periplasmic protein TonB